VSELDGELAAAQDKLKSAEPAAREIQAREVERIKAEQTKAKDALAAALKPLRTELAAKEKASPLDDAPLAYAVREGKPTDAKIQKGGNPRDLGAVVKRGVPACLDRGTSLPITEGSSGRLELAHWLTDSPVKALTARVMVNRIWQHHFGKAIVPTPS